MSDSYKLIKEFNTEIITEKIKGENNNPKWTISGVTLQSDIKNENNRIYPKSILSEAINKHVEMYMKTSRSLGELNHPESGISTINLDRVSHKFIEVKEDGNNFITKAEVLDTPCGKIVQNLLEGNVQLGISSRGLGNIKSAKDHFLIESLYLVSLGDIVSDPSCRDAYINGVLESVEYRLLETGEFVAKEVFTEMDKYNRIIKQAKPEEINKAVQQIFKEFLTKIK